MRLFFCWLAMLLCLANAAPRSKPKQHPRPAARSSKPAPHRAAAASHVNRSSPQRRSNSAAARGKPARGRYARGKSTTRGHASVPRATVQGSPSSDRYREIQAALAAKGYLKSAPSGVWDQDSMDAMRRFQEDQKLTVTGKLNSLSLIALGLGPKDTGAKTPEAPRK